MPQAPSSLHQLFDTALQPLGGSAVTLQEALLHLLLAFVLSLPLAVVYIRTHHGMSYSRGYVQSLVLLSLIVTTVMMAVGDSLARAFGLFGALALIRFRTPVKDTRDATYLFLAVGIGICICTGVGNLLLACVGTGFALLVALVLAFGRFGERLRQNGMLRLCLPGHAELEGRLHQVLEHYCRSFALVRLGGGGDGLEYAYQLQLHDPGSSAGLIADVQAIPGAAAVQLLMQTSHEED